MEQKQVFNYLQDLAKSKNKNIYMLADSLDKNFDTRQDFEDYLNNFKKMSVLDFFRLCNYLDFDDIRKLANLLSEQDQWTQQQQYC